MVRPVLDVGDRLGHLGSGHLDFASRHARRFMTAHRTAVPA